MRKTAIRNFLAIALVLCMMLQLPAVFAAGKIFPDITEDEADSSKLLTVGRKDEGSSEKPGENQTRDYLAFLQKLGIITEETAGKMDVLSVYKAAYSLKGAHMSDDFIAQQAAQSGISQDARLTYPQAVKVVLDALDYTGMAQLKGGYPNGYLFVANALRLATNVDVTNFAPADFYALLFNALGTSASTMELSGGDAYLILGEATILEEYFDVYIEKEVVTACYKKSISQNVVNEDEILLGQRVVKNGGFDMSNMVGSKIKAYVYQGDPYGELYFYESESTKTLTLDLSKIDRDSIPSRG